MQFHPLALSDAFLIHLDLLKDERGHFARTFCEKEFASQGLSSNFPQCNLSYNRKRGTLRGMHFQMAPHEEAKLLRCVRGSIFDVID